MKGKGQGHVVIRALGRNESPPMPLLLLADPSEELVRDCLCRGQCFVAELDEEVIGVYVLLPTRPLTVEIVNVAVAPPFQGRGIGKRLIGHAIETARQQGYKTIEIGTGNSSIGQLALYQKFGFRITGIDRDFFVRRYRKPIWENGIQCRDMIRLSQDLT